MTTNYLFFLDVAFRQKQFKSFYLLLCKQIEFLISLFLLLEISSFFSLYNSPQFISSSFWQFLLKSIRWKSRLLYFYILLLNLNFFLYFLEDRDECKEMEEMVRTAHEDWDQLVYCNHHCVNIPGSYQCTCRPGFSLHEDQHTCKGLSLIYFNDCFFTRWYFRKLRKSSIKQRRRIYC